MAEHRPNYSVFSDNGCTQDPLDHPKCLRQAWVSVNGYKILHVLPKLWLMFRVATISSNRRPVINDGAQNGPLDLVGRSWGSYQPVRTLQSRQLQDVSWCLLKNICLIEVPTLTDKEHNELLSKHFLLGCFRQNLNTYLSRLDPDLLNICPACKNSPHDNNHHFA